MIDHERQIGSKATLVCRFDGSAFLLSPDARKIEFRTGTSLEEVLATVRQHGWRITVEHLHGERRVI